MSNSKHDRSVDRRRFLTTFAMGAAAAPLVSLGRSVFAGGSAAEQAASLCYSNKRVLSQSDLRYLGAMRSPTSGADLTFSYGGMTGRKVNGQVHLLMTGALGKGDPIYELADTGVYNTNWTQAPRMSVVRVWGDVYGNCRKTWYPTGAEKVGYPRYPGSLHWSESTQLLYWTYYDTYNTTGDEDWCLGASRLDPSGAVAFGPWRPAPMNGAKKGPWHGLRISESPSGELICGGIITSGNHSSPWGPDLWAGPLPTAARPAGFGAPDLPMAKHLTYYPMIGKVGKDGSFSKPVVSCRRPGDYFFEPIFANGGVPTEIDPQKNGGVGSWTQVDTVGGCYWLDLPDVHGALFTGRLGAGHVWYRNAGVGNEFCSHGAASPVQVTGPVFTDAYPFLMIYDPADLNAVRAGSVTDHTVNPAHSVNAQAAFGIKTSAVTSLGSAKMLGGMYLDTATRKLYVCAPEADDAIVNFYVPLVHVFQIA